tara:strand:- start:1170 stop:1817 length:648 start_codon:yes stop_codon:yes gene_type:complete
MASTTDYLNLNIYQDETLDEIVTFDVDYQIENYKIIAKISKDYSNTAFTGDDDANKIVAYVINNVGSGYTNGTHTLAISGGNGVMSGGTDAVATCVIDSGKISSVTISNAGSGYTSQPTVALPSGAKTGSPDGLASISLLVGEAGSLTFSAKASQDAKGDTYTISLPSSKTSLLDDGFTGYWDLIAKDNATGIVTRHINGEVYLKKSVTKEGAFL